PASPVRSGPRPGPAADPGVAWAPDGGAGAGRVPLGRGRLVGRRRPRAASASPVARAAAVRGQVADVAAAVVVPTVEAAGPARGAGAGQGSEPRCPAGGPARGRVGAGDRRPTAARWVAPGRRAALARRAAGRAPAAAPANYPAARSRAAG